MAKGQNKESGGAMTSRSDAAALSGNTGRVHDQDARLAESRKEQADNAEHDSRDNLLEANEYSANREHGYFGFAPAGYGENDAPWAREETGGNAEGPVGESLGKITKKGSE